MGRSINTFQRGDVIQFRLGMRECVVGSLLVHALFFYLLSLIRVPVTQLPPRHFAVHFKFLEVKPPEIVLKPEKQPPVKMAMVHQRHIPRELFRRPMLRNPSPVPRGIRLTVVPAAHHTARQRVHGNRPIRVEDLTGLEIVKKSTARAAESTFKSPIPDPLDKPRPHSDIRSPGPNLPDGMRLDRSTPLRPTHDLPHGVPMAELPRPIEHRTNGSGSPNHAEAGPKMALLDRRNGMGLDTFKPTPFSAGGGPTSAPGADDPNPGEGGIQTFSGATDQLGSAEPSPNAGGGPLGFNGPGARPRPGQSDVMTAPDSDWHVKTASGPNGSLGTGKTGRSGRGGGGIGGADSPAGAFHMRAGHGGGPGEGAGGGLGGGIGHGVGRGFGAGVGGGDGLGGGQGGAGRGSGVGAGYGSGKPGTLGNGVPDGVGDGGGGGRLARFVPGGGGEGGGGTGLRPGGGNPGQTMAAYEIGCVLTNQQPAFDAAKWHARSMTMLLQFVGKGSHIKVRIPRDTPDSYVNLIDGDINQARVFTYADIRGYPMIFLTGDRSFTLTPGEKAALRRYVFEDGGTIYGEDCHSPDGRGNRGGFEAPFLHYVEEIFGRPVEELTMRHPIFHILFPIDEIPMGDMRENDPIDGLDINGHTAIIYTHNDYGDVWSPEHTYYPSTLRPPAYRLGANIYLYALTHYLEHHRAE